MNELQRKSLYGTHMPILARIMDISDGPVLEMGMGIFSTPLLDMMCSESKRELVSYDNDVEWFDQNKEWESDYHKVHLVEDWDLIDIKRHWSVAFIDHKPAKRRKEDIKRLALLADYVVVHDTEPESDKFFKYSWVYDKFLYRYDYTKCRPNTTVLSNFKDLKFLR